jgi:predicted ATP-grasp superfamily ATP-dependent carboligase
MGHTLDPSTPLVMLRSGHHGGLGLARSLGRMGVPVYSVDATPWEPVFTSRYCRGRFMLDIDNLPVDVAVEQLLAIGKKAGARPVLIPTTDQACLWVAGNTRALSQDFRYPVLDAQLVHTLCDKSRMQELARQHGVAIAQSTTPRSKEDVIRFLDQATFPVMVKETGGGRLRARAGASKFVVQTPRELVELFDRAGDPDEPNLMFQEFIPGVDWMFNGYFDSNSQCLFGMSGKKIRRFPVHTGVTSLGVCLRNDTVIRTTIEFMQAIGYRGILDIGYRWDMRDGSYRVLDINPRIGCTFRLFAAADGMDVARALYLDLTGQPVPAAEVANGRKWLVEDFDLFSALGSWRKDGLSIKDWISSLAGVEEAACFALDDPIPFLMLAVFDCCELFRWRRSQAEVRHATSLAPEPVPFSPLRRY